MLSTSARLAAAALLVLASTVALGQRTLDQMPRYDRYQRLQRQMGAILSGEAANLSWADDSRSFTYVKDGKAYRFSLDTMREEELSGPVPTPNRRRGGFRGGPERGRQFDSATSPDGKLRAVSRDRNVYIEAVGAKDDPAAVTTEGDAAKRLKFGIACWVYGEELGVRDAMWWSPDSKKLAFYRFDESEVRDYYIGYNQTSVQDVLNQEAYPKAGAPNPKVTVWIYDLDSKQTVQVHTAFGDPSLAEYIYDVKWSPDGKYLLFNRTNRKQNHMQFCAADPATGAAHSIVDELQPQSWAENHPEVEFLKDNNRFVWTSERNGYKNYYLYNMDGAQIAAITQNKADAIRITKLDEDHGALYYTSYGPDLPYCRQFHRARLDGGGDQLLTDPAYDHTVELSPDGSHFLDTYSTSDRAPATRLMDANGKLVKEISHADTGKFDALHLKKTEVFTFRSGDNLEVLYGTLQFPSDFDPNKKYPLLLSVYGGPESGGINAAFSLPNPITELGFIVVNIAGRGTQGRGKAFRDALYEKMGIVEIDDQAAGIKSLASRKYVDMSRVGVFGTSYGGYSTVMCMLRHPEVFKVGCSSSPVTDWRNYDSVYTERYDGLPDSTDNESGYLAGAAATYARDLQGWLMLYFGTADNNVHPSNTIQLVRALEDAGKPYDMQIGPDQGHSQMNASTMWAYFVKHLILNQP